MYNLIRKYAQLPEVRKRREEEKRQAEYSTYRLKAQLFNKVYIYTVQEDLVKKKDKFLSEC